MTRQKLNTCEGCGQPFPPRHDESRARYAARQHCSRDCITTARLKNHTARTCAHCDKPLTIRDGEKPYQFKNRKYCDRACFYASRADNPTNQWTTGDRRPRARQRSDRDVHFSRASLMPADVTQLGKRREYPPVKPLGEPCPVHPSNTIGAFGCPACNAGQRWATRQRQTKIRPHHEGGR